MTSQNPKSPIRFYLLMALSLIGIGFSVYLSQHFYEVRTGTGGFKSFCNISSKMNCDAVAASSYSELFLGIPLSAFGTGWLLAIFAVCMMGMATAWRRVAARALIAMTGFGVLTSLYYFYIMFGVLGTYCLFCLLLDGINFALFGVALTLLPDAKEPGPTSAEEMSGWKTIIGTALATLFVAVIATKGMDQTNFKSSDVEMMAQQTLSQPQLPVNINDNNPTLGLKTAPITIVEFSDFQCPHCRLAAMQLNTILNRYPNKVRVVFRNFPLDQSCNSHMPRPMHEYACEAARVAYCANQQGKFKEVFESIYENQTKLAPGKSAELAKEEGVDPQKLEACVKSPETQLAIQTDIEEGTRLGIEATPTFFVNGHKLEGGVPIPVWDKVIGELAK